MAKKELAKINKSLLKDIEKEIQQDYHKQIRNKVKKLVKEIRMTEILLEQQKQQLNNYLSGKVEITDEELLFDDE